MRKFLIPIIAAASALAVAAPAMAQAQWAPPRYNYQPYDYGRGYNYHRFAGDMNNRVERVRRDIRDNFVKTKVDDTELTYGAIRGMLRSLGDRFTRFLTPEEYEKFNEQTTGEFEGIGARIDVIEEYNGSPAAKPFGASRPYIVEPIEGGPAEKAGLKKDDVILAVDGHSTAEMSEDAVVAYIRGVRGTQSDVKKAVVTLAEGHKIDVTTGL